MMNMSGFSRFIVLAALLVSVASCRHTARIHAVIADKGVSEIVVKRLDINTFSILDTVKVDSLGTMASYEVDVKKGQPEFVYLFHGDRKIASLILQAGDKVSVLTDTLGHYMVKGSEESSRLAAVERDYSAAVSRLNALAVRIEEAASPEYAMKLRQEIGQEYVAYYRGRVKYIMENSRSLSVVPVFYQTFGSNLPVFGQQTDAIHFRNVADSLSLAYPESKYVKALRQEADRRFGYLELQTRLANAEPIAYPEIELPDLQGQKRKLSEVEGKVVMVQFWTVSDNSQKMFNLDVLKPLYEEFHSKGLEIYQVSLDVDKGLWAQVVKEQQHQWVSVCDSRGSASPYALTYNIQALPALYIISDGELVDGAVVDEASLRKLLRKLL